MTKKLLVIVGLFYVTSPPAVIFYLTVYKAEAHKFE